MAVSAEQIEAVHDLFADLGPLTHRRMMGGASFCRSGTIFAMIGRDGVTRPKADGPFAERLAARGSGRFSIVRKDGSVATMGYWSLPPDAADDPDAASALAGEALSRLG
ncbi:DNA transformation protein [Hasllibacter halocynthiae]|uniref:DNA transformation protein n=1 Tax=Hasllibacter halocynthiae TaxID=595589 RepID=A0A2T0X7J4_9RHOB|nr:TfoX/Sxy family protein [Hasllibacter halocynthiae]PRY94922.1 DNA transformation protein [Hasllibacter halocynthiae]